MAQERVTQLVVIGASAGGVEALQTLVAHLPADCPAPIVIAQHLSPDRASRLPEILSARSTLPVEVVETQTKLSPGVVYVVPANRHVQITDHTVSVTGEREPGPMPSIDLLLRSAARVFGESLIAVILTGLGDDGAAGARVVKASGGTVIIQNPETASFPAMPRSLSPTTVDIVAELESIGALLGELLAGGGAGAGAGPGQELRALLEDVRERSGIDFSAYKMPTIQRRLQRRMVATGAASLSEYVRLLQQAPDEYQRLANSFLIKVTEFFRDRDTFEYLRQVIMPELIAVAQDRGELRIWSAGCATGEEAYSLAILVADMLGETSNVNVRIFATDVDLDAVSFARQGIYPAAALSNLPEELVERYFTRSDGHYEARQHIRSMVVFGQHDLGQRAPFPRIDLVCCRNVLIYFTAELQRRALQLFAFSLRDQGYLVLGKAETVSPLPENFATVEGHLKVYRRIGERFVLPMMRTQSPASPRLPHPSIPRRLPSNLPPSPVRGHQPGAPQTMLTEMTSDILQKLPLGVVVVNRQYTIQLINAVARRLLGVHTAAVGEDLMHLVQHAPLLPLRNAINAAFRGEVSTLQFQVSGSQTTTAQPIDLELFCHPEPGIRERQSAESVTISVMDVTRFVSVLRARDQELLTGREQLEQLVAQAEQIMTSHTHLLDANEQLTQVITELSSENEELLLSNEEAQSATEEVETLNEEMQATNEELETLNEELQATIEELNTTNDDLHARSIDLHDLTVSLEAQRARSEVARERLLLILNSLQQPLLVIGSTGQVTFTNTAYEELVGDTSDQAARNKLLRGNRQIESRAASGEEFTSTVTIAVRDGTRRQFDVRSVPMEDEDSNWRGVIILTERANQEEG